VVEQGARGGPLIGGRGGGRGGEVASTGELATVLMMAHRSDGTARAGGEVKGRLGHSAQGRMMPNRAGERVNGEATGQTVASGECTDSLVTGEGEKGLTGGARLPERAIAREREVGWIRPSRGGRISFSFSISIYISISLFL
jgi:hypothetical protein